MYKVGVVMKSRLPACLLLVINLVTFQGFCSESLSLEVLGEELTVERYPANGDQLVLFISTGMGEQQRISSIAAGVAERGIEFWQIDLVDNLFLPRARSTYRQMDGSIIASLITQAHAISGKHVTVMVRAYASVPVLRGVRLWQQQQAAAQAGSKHNSQDIYLNGVVLISPELYIKIPDLGLDPVFASIVSATNVPIMVFQSGRNGNRWQLGKVITELQKGGAQVYSKVFPGVTGIVYSEDNAAETMALISDFPREIERAIQLLVRTITPIAVAELKEKKTVADSIFDTTLRPFQGNRSPLALELTNAKGKKISFADYKGKVTLVNFWATWCRPCVEEIPSLNRLRKRMQGKPFQLISVDYAEDRDTIEAFMQDVNVDFPVLLDTDGTVSAKWGVVVFPSTFVIDPDGKIVYGVKGGIHWDTEEVIKLLDNLLDETTG
jgi:peroxiredoxin